MSENWHRRESHWCRRGTRADNCNGNGFCDISETGQYYCLCSPGFTGGACAERKWYLLFSLLFPHEAFKVVPQGNARKRLRGSVNHFIPTTLMSQTKLSVR